MERISSYYSLEHLVQTLEELGVPEEYICPITQDFMRDPCLAEDGSPPPPKDHKQRKGEKTPVPC